MNSIGKWDDLRIVLAIAETGSLSGAGRSLGLSHATVFRRLRDIEERLGAKLFDRVREGYAPTLAGEDITRSAQRIAAEVMGSERRIAGQDLRPAGTVRVTTTDSLLFGPISPVLAGFRAAYPEIALEVAMSNQIFNLSKREADVAIRPSAAPPESLTGRKLARIDQAIYGRRDLVTENGATLDIRSTDWVGPDEGMAYRPLERWMEANDLNARCRTRVDSVLGMFVAAQNGCGLAVLPCYLGDREQSLRRVGQALPDLATDLWLLTHPDLRRVARIRLLLDFTAQACRQDLFDAAA